MKNKGFTLIELLAVIVILAIIALIATPIILSMINNARKSAAKSSAYGYIEAIDSNNGFADAEVEGYTKITDGTYDTSDITVSMKGKAPASGEVTIENGRVKEAAICISGYNVEYEAGKEAEVGNKCGGFSNNEATYTTYTVGQAINFNPVTNEECTTPTSTPGTKTGCMKWYVIKESGSHDSTVDVILDHNTTAKVYWNSSGKSSDGMNEVATTLSNDTSQWVDGLNKRLITANEVASIAENDGWDSATANQYFHLGSNDTTTYSNQTSEQKAKQRSLAWLFDYTYACTSFGCNTPHSSTTGYWTSSTFAGNLSDAWIVGRNGDLSNVGVGRGSDFGIRPVITVSKSVFN